MKNGSPNHDINFKPKGDDETDKLLANILKDLNLDLGNIKIGKIGNFLSLLPPS